MILSHSPNQNRILVGLPPADYARLLPDLELVSVPVGEGIYEPDIRIAHLYFFSDRLRYRSLKWVAKWPGYPDFSNGKRRNGRRLWFFAIHSGPLGEVLEKFPSLSTNAKICSLSTR